MSRHQRQKPPNQTAQRPENCLNHFEACLVKWMFQAVEEPNRRGLWFENIAGHNIPSEQRRRECESGSSGISQRLHVDRAGDERTDRLGYRCPSVVQYAATANLPWGMDEIEVAGAVFGKPVVLVKATSIDLLAPADAEIVIEGEIFPGKTDIR